MGRALSAYSRSARLGLEDPGVSLTRLLELDFPFKPFVFADGVLTPRTPLFETIARRRPSRAPICARLHRRMRSLMTHIGLGRVARALRRVEEELDESPSSPELLAFSGRLKQFSNRVAEAIDDYEEALKLDGEWALGRAWLGEAWMQLGDVRRGLVELSAAADKLQGDPWVHAWIWAGYAWLGDEPRARAALAHALKTSPGQAEFHALAGSRGERAPLDRALKLSPRCIWALILRAHFRYLAGDHRGAESDWTGVLRLDRRSPWAFVMRSWARRKRGDAAGARKDLEEAVRLEPGCIIGFLEEVGRRGCLLYHPFGAPTGWIAGQTRMLQRALGRRDGGSWHYAALADYFFSYEFALTDIQAGLKRHPDSAVLLAFLARAYGPLGRRRLGPMRAAMDKAIALEPKMGWLYAWRAEVRKRAGDPRGAERDLGSAVRLDPIYPINFCWRASARRKMGDYPGALRDLDRSLDLIRELGEDYDFLFTERRIVLRSLGMPLAAVNEYCEKACASASFPWADQGAESAEALKLAKLSKRYPREPRIRAVRAEVLARAGKTGQALLEAERALSSPRPPALAYWAKAESLRLQGRFTEALAAIDAAVAMRPFSPRFYAFRCRLLSESGKIPQAIADLDRIQVLIWRYESFYIYRARLRRFIGLARRSVGELNDLLLVNARHPWAHYERFLCSLESGRPLARILTDLVRAKVSGDLDCGTRVNYFTLSARRAVSEDFPRLAKARGKAFALAWRGVIYSYQGSLSQARRDWEQALRLDERCAWVLAWRAHQKLEEGRPAASLDDLERALRAEPGFAWALGLRGRARLQLSRPREAERDLSAALAIDQGLWECFADRAWVRRERGDIKGALADLDRSLALDKRSAWVYARRGEILLSQGRVADSMADFDEAIILHGDFAQAFLWRSQALTRLGRLPQALEDSERAVSLEPNRPDGYIQRSLVRERMKDYPKQIADMKKAADLLAPPERLQVRRAMAEVPL